MDVIVGIDLGTTACKVTVVRRPDDAVRFVTSVRDFSAPARLRSRIHSGGVEPSTPRCCARWTPPG